MEENSSIFSLIQCVPCHKTLLQQNPLVLNFAFWLKQVVVYNGHKTVTVVVVVDVGFVAVMVAAAVKVLIVSKFNRLSCIKYEPTNRLLLFLLQLITVIVDVDGASLFGKQRFVSAVHCKVLCVWFVYLQLICWTE